MHWIRMEVFDFLVLAIEKATKRMELLIIKKRKKENAANSKAGFY